MPFVRLLASVSLLLTMACNAHRLQETRNPHGHRVFAEHRTKGSQPRIKAVEFSSDGRQLASLDEEGWIVVRDLAKGTSLRWRCHASKGVSMALSPDGVHLATCGEETGSSEQALALWRIRDGAQIHKKATGRVYNALAFQTPDRLLACGWLTSVEAWDPRNGLLLQKFDHPGHDGHMRRLGITPSGVVHCQGEQHTWVWQDGPGRPPLALDCRPDCRPAIILFSEEGPVRLTPAGHSFTLETLAPRDFSEWRLQAQFTAEGLEPYLDGTLAATEDLQWILRRGHSGTYYLWSHRAPQPIVIPGQSTTHSALALDPARKCFAYADSESRITLVKVP